MLISTDMHILQSIIEINKLIKVSDNDIKMLLILACQDAIVLAKPNVDQHKCTICLHINLHTYQWFKVFTCFPNF